MNKIVFIGQYHEPEQTRYILDRCLLSDEEMVAGPKTWKAYFDDYYSVLLVEDAAATAKDLQKILEKILNNTKRHHYFLRIEQQGAEPVLGVPEQVRIGLRDHRVEIQFRLPISAPLDPRLGDIVYRVAEPTYYFEMLHAEEGPAIVLKDAPRNCRYRLEAPRPDAALVVYAASLGINESGGNDLGIQFAETVTIRCE